MKLQYPRIKSATHYGEIDGKECPLTVDKLFVLYKGRWRLIQSEIDLPGYTYIEIPNATISFEIKQYSEAKEWQ